MDDTTIANHRTAGVIGLSVIFLLAVSCGSPSPENAAEEHPPADSASSVNQAVLYNRLIDQLIRNHLYDRYLGCEGKKLLRELAVEGTIDSARYRARKRQLTADIRQGGSPPTRLYVVTGNDSTFFRRMSRERFFRPDSTPRAFFAPFKAHHFDEINAAIRRVHLFDTDELRSDLVDIIPTKQPPQGRPAAPDCNVAGRLTLSDVYFTADKRWGLLFMGFSCGPACGRKALVKIRCEGNRWLIDDTKLFVVL